MRMFFGEPGCGKTLLLTHRCSNHMVDSFMEALDSYDIVDSLNEQGFNFSKKYKHLAFANYDVNSEGLKDPDLRVYKFNPYRFGFYDEKFETIIIPPYSKVFITEFQNYVDSTMYQYLRAKTKAAYQTKRHYFNLDFEVECQAPKDVAKNIRRLFSEFWHLYKKVEHIYKNGVCVGHKFYIRIITGYINLEKYLASVDESTYTEYTFTTNKCYFSNYDSYFAQEIHLRGRENQDLFIKHFGEEDDSDILTPPEGYWESKSDRAKKNKEESEVEYYD